MQPVKKLVKPSAILAPSGYTIYTIESPNCNMVQRIIICFAQFVNLRNFEIAAQIRNFQFAQLFIYKLRKAPRNL